MGVVTSRGEQEEVLREVVSFLDQCNQAGAFLRAWKRHEDGRFPCTVESCLRRVIADDGNISDLFLSIDVAVSGTVPDLLGHNPEFYVPGFDYKRPGRYFRVRYHAYANSPDNRIFGPYEGRGWKSRMAGDIRKLIEGNSRSGGHGLGSF